jgi:NAD(P)-dependent dehydrogenase (short-subunit alcohol dehydrogenase family)
VARTESDLRSLAGAVPVQYLAEAVGTADGCARIAAKATRRLGGVDILVNNAGADLGESPIWDHDPATWDHGMTVNLRGAYELTPPTRSLQAGCTSMSEQSAAREAAGRVADATEVASAIAFLVSEEASGVNGDVLTVALGETW